MLAMKLIRFKLGLLYFSSFLAFETVFTSPTAAQCVQADVSVQYNISGSKKPTDRTNDVVMDSDRSCQKNVSVTTGIQGNVGGNGPVEQHRRVVHRQQGSDRDNKNKGSTIQLRTNVGIDVYNPADNLHYRN